MPTQQITNPAGAFPAGNQTAAQATSPGVGVYYTAVASAAISTVPCTVEVLTDGTYQVKTGTTNGAASLKRGIAITAAATTGQVVDVVAHGLVKNVPVDGTVSAGDYLKQSTTTAGRLVSTATPAVGEVTGVALAASASNVVDVWVAPR